MMKLTALLLLALVAVASAASLHETRSDNLEVGSDVSGESSEPLTTTEKKAEAPAKVPKTELTEVQKALQRIKEIRDKSRTETKGVVAELLKGKDKEQRKAVFQELLKSQNPAAARAILRELIKQKSPEERKELFEQLHAKAKKNPQRLKQLFRNLGVKKSPEEVQALIAQMKKDGKTPEQIKAELKELLGGVDKKEDQEETKGAPTTEPTKDTPSF